MLCSEARGHTPWAYDKRVGYAGPRGGALSIFKPRQLRQFTPGATSLGGKGRPFFYSIGSQFLTMGDPLRL